MKTRSITHRAEQPSALCTNPSVGGSHSSDNTDPLQRNGDVLVDHNELVGGLPDNSGGSQVAFGEKRVPYKIKKCHSNHNCKLCLKFNPSHSFVSSSTNRNYEIIASNHISIINCATSNCVYLITCQNCSIQYVGETGQTLRNRFNLHRSSIRNSQKINNCKILCDHFQKGLCKSADYTVQVIEALPENTTVTSRRKKETEWILKLRTAFPYGLNDKIGEDVQRNDDKPVGISFPSLKRNKNHPVRSKNHAFSKNNSVKSFLNLFKNKLINDLKSCLNFGRSIISSLSKSKLKELAILLNDFITDQTEDFLYLHWYLALIDQVETKLFVKKQDSPKKFKTKNKLNIFFINKGVEIINLPKILRSKNVSSKMPSSMSKDDIPMVTYKLQPPIRSKIFNHKKFVESLDIESFIQNETIIPCNCQNSQFKDPDHGHIITGDLRIVHNNKLRKLITKGPKYRQPSTISWDKAKSSIVDGLNETVEHLSNKFGINKLQFSEWKNEILGNIDYRIDKYKRKFYHQNPKSVLNDTSVKEALENLQHNFVVAPIDKAANNVSFICKRFYAATLLKELGVIGLPSKTYRSENGHNKNNIINSTVKDMTQQYSINIAEDMKTLPTPYWMPKMHKSPIGARFIIASKKCALKPLSKNITSAFKLLYKSVEKYHSKSKSYSGVNSFWIIQNNKPVIDTLNKLNNRKAAKSVTTYDFSTLYTNIPHDKLIRTINSVIDFAFKGRTQEKISINSYGIANWCNSSKYFVFDIKSLKKAVEYVIKNCYFAIGDQVFQQIIGIPMGSDPAPFFANLFLFYYEWQFINNLKKVNVISARKFCYTFRFIDDLITINNANFEINIRNIYPAELELKKENDDDKRATFLDLDIEIRYSKFKTKLYDKRDNFDFNIIRMPYKSSNIPQKMFYSAMSAEILRICKATTSFKDFLESTKILITRIKKQGGLLNHMTNAISKLLNNHKESFIKFRKSNDYILDKLL